MLIIELYIRTTGRTGDASCTSATGLQEDTHVPFCTRIDKKHTLEFVFIERYAMLFFQLTKWPHKHTLSNACLFNLENGRLPHAGSRK